MPPKSGPRPSVNAPTPREVASILLAQLGLEVVSCTRLQTLWAGYGHIMAVTARPSSSSSASTETSRFVLKLISPPPGDDEGHLRKMLSYEVELEFYHTVGPTLPPGVAVARCLASTRSTQDDRLYGVTAMLLNDLRVEYPVAGAKRSALSPISVHAALVWLARFHASSRGSVSKEELGAYVLPPLEEAAARARGPGRKSLWLNGGYTYLATRRGELAGLEESDSEWASAFCDPHPKFGRSVAEAVAAALTPRGRDAESIIHGDVKSENLFTNKKGDEVAFFDFQYVGLGLGVCDLAKLFTCSVPLDMLVDDDIPNELDMQDGERALLETYRKVLLGNGEGGEYDWSTFTRHWQTALVDWCRFQASWGFWGNTEWLEARVRHILADKGWRDWLKTELEQC